MKNHNTATYTKVNVKNNTVSTMWVNPDGSFGGFKGLLVKFDWGKAIKEALGESVTENSNPFDGCGIIRNL